MRNKLLIFLLISATNMFAQDTANAISKHEHWESFIGLGIDNNKYEGLNQCLKSFNLPGNFNPKAFVFSYGLLVNHKRISREIMISFSGQSYTTEAKQYSDHNASAQFLLHYRLIKHGWLKATIYSGINIDLLYLNIDSIYKPSGIGLLNSISGTKFFLNIPVGAVVKHHFQFKNNKNPLAPQGWFLGVRGAYHFAVYQDVWQFGNINTLAYQIKPANYFEVSLLVGLYGKQENGYGYHRRY